MKLAVLATRINRSRQFLGQRRIEIAPSKIRSNFAGSTNVTLALTPERIMSAAKFEVGMSHRGIEAAIQSLVVRARDTPGCREDTSRQT
jgi:hypothetical protein